MFVNINIYIYTCILAYFKRFSVFLGKKLVIEKIVLKNFNIARNNIISVEPTMVEHTVNCQTI